ncbi:MAG TPA: class I tRNA ligase family protein, partial [Candidatus Rubrimentiphilum sp.]|nr:class I tRNA ligase family protein [Candidatus Rubrimentiphilum sp.]
TGTGAVHTAPGHGADDFETGVKYNLPIINPVNARGVFTAEAGPYAGLHIWKANPKIVEDLGASGALWDATEYAHSYPHCWRCHNPVVFRATAQWFIAMDQNRLRARAIENTRAVEWLPAWGEQRMEQMLQTHPEWCISRQRTWGTPIPAVSCSACGESLLDARVARIAAERFREKGADSWWQDPVQSFLPEGFTCPKCRGATFEKEKDIVDIWFESGVTHLAVLGHDGLPWPSDAVLEGPDQYRGWFRSSLVTATAVKGAAPYKRVVKNGWVNDEQGRPMSKSLGTGIDAKDAMQQYGADVLRLWTASVEFLDDVRFGPTVLEQVGRVYRNLRNRLRFMVSNLTDLDEPVTREKFEPLDAVACEVTDRWIGKVRKLFAGYNLHGAYLELVSFESDDLSSFYFDALKDRLYSSATTAPRRRSAQSALLYILQQMLSVLAALLSFTAEEAWQAVPDHLRGDRRSVFDLSPAAGHPANARSVALWNVLKELRQQVAATQTPRDFEADASLVQVPEALLRDVQALGDGLREALVVSDVERIEGKDDLRRVELRNAKGSKCQRCWKYLELGTDPEHPTLCAPCAEIVRLLER